MHILIKSTVALTLMINQASALSCTAIDMASSYAKVAESSTSYVILSGTFKFATRPEAGETPREEKFLTQFSGKLLTSDGFTDEVAGPVTIHTTCQASWCGKMTPDTPYLAFVEQDQTRLNLMVGPCPQTAFFEPTQEMLDEIVACAQGGDCAVN
ncbi:MAG: hypothetical protein ABJ327_16565 [Litoreibacter sp.]